MKQKLRRARQILCWLWFGHCWDRRRRTIIHGQWVNHCIVCGAQASVKNQEEPS